MKVVLFTLNGSWAHSSLSLRCLRAPLEREGHEVVLLEYTLRDRDLSVLRMLYEEHADIYGFSCYIWNLDPLLRLAENLHALLPGTRIVFGGPEVSFATERFDRVKAIDHIVCGEGEGSFPALLRRIGAGEECPRVIHAEAADVMRDEGILYRDGEQTGSLLYYESSRGCPFSCTYCLSSATKGVRMKAVEQVMRDLEAFEKLDLPHRVIKFVDRTFNADVSRANRIWRGLLEGNFSGQYHFEICASLLNEESFGLLSRFQDGKIRLEIGLQSTNRETLAAVSRHLDPEKVLSAVRRVYRMGNIHVHLDLIAGLPYEDYASFAASFDAAYGCCHVLQLGFLKLLHGTALRERSEEYGYVSTVEPPYTVLCSRWLSFDEMQRLHRIAELLERYMESGRFTHALWYLNARMPSPFAFWEGLSAFLESRDRRPLQKISQPDAYRYLLEYVKVSYPEIDASALRELLAVDFSASEHKNPPYFLK